MVGAVVHTGNQHGNVRMADVWYTHMIQHTGGSGPGQL